MDKGVAHFLKKHAGLKPASFHMPGHKGAGLYKRFGHGDFLTDFLDYDITEIPGADNLFQTEGIILETMEKYRLLYDSHRSYLMINGTSGGLIASIMTSVPAGGKLIMARTCHKSVFNGLALSGAEPVYAYPEMVPEYGISGPVTPEEIARLLDENPDSSAVILPSPNYYGICSDIKSIADIVHAHGKVLIVDQAHGAHLKFFSKFGNANNKNYCSAENKAALNMPRCAEDCGADLVVNSTHKTLASLTQSAVLNVSDDAVRSGRVDLFTLENKIQAIESTSPSYILMGSLDINADILTEHGTELISEWTDNLSAFYASARQIPGLKFMDIPGSMDSTKINLDMSAYGIDGGQLEELLMEQGIFAELTTGNILMCMTGIGNTAGDYERLLQALQNIAINNTQRNDVPDENLFESGARLWTKQRPLHKVPTQREMLDLDDCAGRVCASSIIPYPPGIPLICPGEELEQEEIDYIKELRRRGEKVIGLTAGNQIAVGR